MQRTTITQNDMYVTYSGLLKALRKADSALGCDLVIMYAAPISIRT
jgi:hypothetical protein